MKELPELITLPIRKNTISSMTYRLLEIQKSLNELKSPCVEQLRYPICALMRKGNLSKANNIYVVPSFVFPTLFMANVLNVHKKKERKIRRKGKEEGKENKKERKREGKENKKERKRRRKG